MPRRLPIYLVLDTSGSMLGEPITAMENGVDNLVSSLRQDPHALESAHLSVICFDNEATQVVPLTDLNDFQTPHFAARGLTSLGKALKLLADRLDNEVTKSTTTTKGDWKPLVFIFTDGAPNDAWEEGLEEFKKRKVGIVVACAAGPDADDSILQQITPNVVRLETMDSAGIRAFFRWVSASISTGSQRVDAGQETTGSDLPTIPEELHPLF